MTIRNHITDPSTGKKASVVKVNSENALVVATCPLRKYYYQTKQFVNDAYGANMNIDAAASGTPLEIHDGTDSVLWTASVIVGGKFTFNSVDQNHTPAGALSIKLDNGALNDTFQLAAAAPVDLSNYVSLSMWIYVDKDWSIDDEIEVVGWDTATGLEIGNPVGIGNYFNSTDNDTWHKAIISFLDMGVTNLTIDALRFTITKKAGKSPKCYFDDIAFEESGAPIDFCIKPDLGTWYIVDSIRAVMVRAHDSTLANNSIPNLAYNKLLGLSSLIAGITVRIEKEDRTLASVTFKNLGELLESPGVNVFTGGDATNTWMVADISFLEPIILKAATDGRLCVTVSDDLSSFLKFRVTSSGRADLRGLGEEIGEELE